MYFVHRFFYISSVFEDKKNDNMVRKIAMYSNNRYFC